MPLSRVLVLLAVGVSLASAQTADRRAQARQGEAELAATHFFHKGRGTHAIPGVQGLVELLGKPFVPEVFRAPLDHRMGLNMVDGRAIGLFSVTHAGAKLGVFGCAVCHSSKAAGQLVIGLGNKNIDPGMVGKLVSRLTKIHQWTRAGRSAEVEESIARAMVFMRKLTDPRLTNATQGNVSISIMTSWFYEQAGAELPPGPAPTTKVPHLWGLEAKAPAGLFYDGFASAASLGWLATPDLTAGQSHEIVREIFGRYEGVYRSITKLLPPPYPFAIDATRAARGREIFARDCRGCHGDHARDAAGLPVWDTPRLVPWAAVGTSRDRLDAITPHLKRLIRASPASDLAPLTDHAPGYFAPRLEGIWARFPYLHNGSVPTLEHLLSAPASRPTAWSLHDGGERHRFDAERVGYTVPPPGSAEARALENAGKRGARDVYWTGRPGHGSAGHGSGLSADDRHALIEYLKTL